MVGVRELEIHCADEWTSSATDFLPRMSDSLEKITIRCWASGQINLEHFARMKNLKELFLAVNNKKDDLKLLNDQIPGLMEGRSLGLFVWGFAEQPVTPTYSLIPLMGRDFYNAQLKKEEARQKEWIQYPKLAHSHAHWLVAQEHAVRSGDDREKLIWLAKGPDKGAVLRAIGLLGSGFHEDDEVDEVLTELTRHRDDAVAVHAAMYTCYHGSNSGIDVLLGFCSHPDPRYRRYAINSLRDSAVHFGLEEKILTCLHECSSTENDPGIQRLIEEIIERIEK